MSRTELAQVMPWRERVPWNGTASRGQNTLRVYTILLQGKQPKQQLRQDNITTAFPAKGNLVVKYCKCCICCLFLLPFLVLCYYPNPPFFRMIHFCARRDVDCCALYHGISSSYSTQVFTISVYKIGPWANPINDRLMFRLTTINVSINVRLMSRWMMINVKTKVRFMQ